MILIWISRRVQSNVTLAPVCCNHLLIKHFFELLLSILSPRNYMCIQKVEIGVVLSNNYNVVPRFLASLLHLGLIMLGFSDFTASFLEVNPVIPFACVPQTHRKTLLRLWRNTELLCSFAFIVISPLLLFLCLTLVSAISTQVISQSEVVKHTVTQFHTLLEIKVPASCSLDFNLQFEGD